MVGVEDVGFPPELSEAPVAFRILATESDIGGLRLRTLDRCESQNPRPNGSPAAT